MVKHITVLLVLVNLSACISLGYKPAKEQLVPTADCKGFNGLYVFESLQTGRKVYKYLFENESEVELVNFEVNDCSVEITGFKNNQAIYHKSLSRNRSTCSDSILTLVTKDESYADGFIMTASDQKLQFFSPSKEILSVRIIDTGIAFIFIVPYFSSTDDVLNFKRNE
jgi:hypothetical protein